MTTPDPVDELLGSLRMLSGARFLSDEARAAAGACRQILLDLKRDKVPEGERRAAADQFMGHWDSMQPELAEHGVAMNLVTFAVEGDTLHVRITTGGAG